MSSDDIKVAIGYVEASKRLADEALAALDRIEEQRPRQEPAPISADSGDRVCPRCGHGFDGHFIRKTPTSGVIGYTPKCNCDQAYLVTRAMNGAELLWSVLPQPGPVPAPCLTSEERDAIRWARRLAEHVHGDKEAVLDSLLSRAVPCEHAARVQELESELGASKAEALRLSCEVLRNMSAANDEYSRAEKAERELADAKVENERLLDKLRLTRAEADNQNATCEKLRAKMREFADEADTLRLDTPWVNEAGRHQLDIMATRLRAAAQEGAGK